MKLIGDCGTPATPANPEFKSITVCWPLGSKIPTIHGKWKRLVDGRVEAIYTASELAVCLMIAEIINEQEPVE